MAKPERTGTGTSSPSHAKENNETDGAETRQSNPQSGTNENESAKNDVDPNLSKHATGNNEVLQNPLLLPLTPDSVYEFYVHELFPAVVSSLPILFYRIWNDALSWAWLAGHKLYVFVQPTWMTNGGTIEANNETTANILMHLHLAEKDLGGMIQNIWEQAVQSSKQHVNATFFFELLREHSLHSNSTTGPLELLARLPATANIIIQQEAAAVEKSFWTWFSREWPLMDWKIGVFLWQTFGGVLLVVALLSIMPGRLHTWSGKLLRWPILGLTYLLINVELVVYVCIRLGIRLIEAIVATPKHRALRAKMANESSTYEEWYGYASELDASQKRTLWQSTTTDETSYQYNWPLIQQLIADMRAARCDKKDPILALAVLQQCTRKNVGGIMNEDLFTKTYTGEPKFIVMEFIGEVTKTLYWVTEQTLTLEEREELRNETAGRSSTSRGGPKTYEQNLQQKSKAEHHKLWRNLVAFATLDFSTRTMSQNDEQEEEPLPSESEANDPGSPKSTGSGRQQPPVNRAQLLKFLKRAKHAYGKTALCLSGGSMMGLYHLGHLKGLMETDCLPEIVSGCSAGSAIGAVLCTRTNDELHQDLDPTIIGPRLKCFDRTWSECLRSVWKTGNLFDGDDWLEMIKWFTLGDTTFEEAYQKTGRVLCIALAATAKKTPPILLTYISSPNVTIASAVVASAAVPGFVSPRRLQIKDPVDGTIRSAGPETYFDGSIKHDIPTAGLSEMLNCHFFVACQCNPHIVPFFFNAKGGVGRPTRWSGGEKETSWRGGFLLAALEMYIKNDMRAKFVFLRDLDAAVSFTGTMMTQSFEGTTTIVPQVELRDFFTLFRDPSVHRLYHYLKVGSVAAYQHAAMIRCHYRIADALEECIERLEAGVGKGPRQQHQHHHHDHAARREAFGQYESPLKQRASRRACFETGSMRFEPGRCDLHTESQSQSHRSQRSVPEIVSQRTDSDDSVSTASETGTLPPGGGMVHLAR